MCTDHQRNGHHHHDIKPTITRIPLARIAQPSRWSRRRLLVSGGLGTASMAILAACGSDSTAATTTTTTSAAPASEAEPTESPADTSEAEAAEFEDPAEESAPAEEAESGSTELQLQHVSLGFVSAYVPSAVPKQPSSTPACQEAAMPSTPHSPISVSARPTFATSSLPTTMAITSAASANSKAR